MVFLLLLFGFASAFGQAGRIYTKPEAGATGGITGKAPVELIHAIAVERDRVRVFLADLSDAGKVFRFEHLPVGKYDLVLVAKDGTVTEGLDLGDDVSKLTETSMANLKKRIRLADGFFNQHAILRMGVTGMDESGDGVLLALVERQRANDVLKQSGERLNEMVRRLEIIELHQATDDWQMTGSRHLYREGEPIPKALSFYKDNHLPALSGIRVIDTTKDLGLVAGPEK
ncbi:MAG: hypothetical protein WCP06_01720 [Verrucomicrobiota bacterium]